MNVLVIASIISSLIAGGTYLINNNAKTNNDFTITHSVNTTEWTNEDVNISLNAISKNGFNKITGPDTLDRKINETKIVNFGDNSIGENFNAVSPTSDGGFIAVGNKGHGNIIGGYELNNTSDALIVKYDKYENVEWAKVWGSPNLPESFWGVTEIKDNLGNPNGYVACGQSLDSNKVSDGVVVKFDLNGIEKWNTRLSSSHTNNSAIFWNVIFDSQNRIIASGFRDEYGDSDYYIRIINDLGSTYTFSDVIGENDNPGLDIWKGEKLDRTIEKPGEGYFSIGMEYDWEPHRAKYGNTKGFLIKFDYNFNVVYRKTLAGTSQVFDSYTGPGVDFDNIYLASNGDLIVLGDTLVGGGDLTGTHKGNSDALIVRYNSMTGNIIWQKMIGGTSVDYVYGVSEIDINGNKYLVTTGTTASTDGDFSNSKNYGSYDVYIATLDSNGNLLNNITRFGGYDRDTGTWTTELIDGRVIVVGTTSSFVDENGNHIPNDNSDAFFAVVNTQMIFNEHFTVSENDTYAYRFIDSNNNTIKYNIEITNIDKIKPYKPTININSNYELTITHNGDVPDSKGISSGIKNIYYKIDNSDWIEYTSVITVPNNTSKIEAKCFDNAGNYSDIQTLDDVDSIPPELTLTNLYLGFSNSSVNIKAFATDNVEVDYIITPSGNKIYSNTCTVNVNSNGIYTFVAFDKNNNHTTKSIIIDNIDKTIPSVAISKDPNKDWSNKDVSIEISAND